LELRHNYAQARYRCLIDPRLIALTTGPIRIADRLAKQHYLEGELMKKLIYSFAFTFIAVATGNAMPEVVYSNFGPGDSVENSIHHVLNEFGYLEHAARFHVPAGTDFRFTGVDVAIVEATEFGESHVSVRLWSNNAGQPDTILESMTTEVLGRGPNYVVQQVESTLNTTLRQNNDYWISLAAINPGSVGWLTNATQRGGYALSDSAREIP
jgi:hypothetical protein